ncbi:hypothetical protein G3570_08975 [Balneolaceae bacterium YR4-1]|uniref:LVIVD repeat-containing protein n=1 Tax=Halalkalibaculum roseum TaxID=2709311 RepID=A0A6M1SZW9_9BACT|nr:hypothetical protein [Halalkalibaculum roseum]NGP76764.1 hypothetical protein [Halalkalibaculum roseum]
MTRITRSIIAIALVAGIIGCDLQSENGFQDDRLKITNDVKSLSSRISIINKPITDQSEPAKALSKAEDEFVHLANVQSPSDQNGNVLSATSVYYHKHLAFVSYHLKGSEYGGAIEMFDLKDPENPEIISQVLFDDTDVNAIVVDENIKKAWYVGGRDVDASGYDTEVHKGAILGEIIFEEKELTENINELPLPSYSGNAVVEMGQNVYATSGATGGGLFQVDKDDFVITESIFRSYSKYIDRRNDDLVGLSVEGDNAMIYTFDFNTMSINSVETGFNVLPKDGKNVVEHRDNTTMIALGNKGVRGYDLSQQEVPVFSFDGLGSDVANGVTADAKYVFIAHGTDGVYITKKSNQNPELELVAQWNDDSGASANYIKTDPSGKTIFVAKGTNGLNILLRK